MGLEEIGFSEHLYLYHLPPKARDPELAMREEDMPRYIGMVEEARERYPDITVRLGLGADYTPHQRRGYGYPALLICDVPVRREPNA